MVVTQFLSTNDTMEISLHEFLNEVYFLEVIQRRRTEDIEDGNDIFVVKVTKEFDLTKSAHAKHGMIERGYSFNGDFSL